MKLTTISGFTVAALVFASASGTALASQNYKGDYKNEAPCPVPPTLHDGYYLGAQAGYDVYRIRQTISGVGNLSSVNNSSNWMGGLFAGYGLYLRNFYYIGAELQGNYNGSNQTTFTMSDDDGDTSTQKFEPNTTWNLSLLPGLKLNDTSLGYLRLGVNWTNFKATETAIANNGGSTFFGSNHTIQKGFGIGLGIETLVRNNWSIRTEYNHIWYKSFRITAGPATETYEPSNNQFTLGVLYHFA